MATDDDARLQLYEIARQTWGGPAADTLMRHLAPHPDRLATTADLELVRADLTVLEANLRAELVTIGGRLDRRSSQLLRTMLLGMVGAHATLVGLVLAILQLR